MDETSDRRKIGQVAEILSKHPFCVALTGAGLSTQSGLPDFRNPGKGLWARLGELPDLASGVMTLQGFKEAPEAFYDCFRPFFDKILAAKPNPAHMAMAEMEACGYIQALITMNGDMLHQKAGSQRVIQIHGTIGRAVCITCYQVVEGLSLWQGYVETGKIPRCPLCGGMMKPDVILTGEQLPAKKVLETKKLLHKCEVVLAAGTSFSGGPVMHLMEKAREPGKKMVIVNLSPTIWDSTADIVIRADVTRVLPAIVEQLK